MVICNKPLETEPTYLPCSSASPLQLTSVAPRTAAVPPLSCCPSFLLSSLALWQFTLTQVQQLIPDLKTHDKSFLLHFTATKIVFILQQYKKLT